MGKFITNFDTTAELAAFSATTDFGQPHVSLTKDDSKVHYFDPYNGHEYVEIGGLKWATMNIGANRITDTGLYFQWGDTQGYTASQVGSGEGQKYFGWADYKYNSGGTEPTDTDITKYNSTDGKTVLEAVDDAAQANWGGQWRMPTTEEYVALGNAVNTAFTADYQGSGVNGMLCTDKTDSSKVLFFPIAGTCYRGSFHSTSSESGYWSSSLDTSNMYTAYYVWQNVLAPEWQQSGFSLRFWGFYIRGVVG